MRVKLFEDELKEDFDRIASENECRALCQNSLLF